MQLTHIKKDF